MKKRLLAVVLCLTMAVGLAGCGQKETSGNDAERIAELEAENAELREEIKALKNDETTSDSGKTNIDETTAETWGVCGADLTWYYANGVLTIRGTGDMADYKILSGDVYDKERKYRHNVMGYFANTPWCGFVDKIQRVEIEDGCTSIGYSAFYICSELSRINIPSTVTQIGSKAFRECDNLDIIEWNGIEYNNIEEFAEAFEEYGNTFGTPISADAPVGETSAD